MWMLCFKNLESGKRVWETGFGWYILRRIAYLYNDRRFEILLIEKLDFNWSNLVSCFFGHSGIIDEESIEAEGKVE